MLAVFVSVVAYAVALLFNWYRVYIRILDEPSGAFDGWGLGIAMGITSSAAVAVPYFIAAHRPNTQPEQLVWKLTLEWLSLLVIPLLGGTIHRITQKCKD